MTTRRQDNSSMGLKKLHKYYKQDQIKKNGLLQASMQEMAIVEINETKLRII
jgi:hypothetical protein